ncbi:hypothetical protein RAD15_40745 [Bradyrhizobium sp. 14AA]
MTSVRSMQPSTFTAHGSAGGEIDEMEPRAGGAGKGRKALSLPSLLLFQMRLHVHARQGASKNDQIGHRRSMTTRRIFIFDLDQFWNGSRPIAAAQD